MSSVIPCPSCRSPLAVTPQLAGQMIACPACGQRIQLAAAPLPAATQAPAMTLAAAPAKPKPESRRSGISPVILISWFVLGGLIMVAGILVWLLRAQRLADEAEPVAKVTQPTAPPPVSRPTNLPP